ncbi:MAG: protein translocase SEC61 complex subunit gamma [Candidatus Woesearchaeota archaeon]|nr:protein translocase SEC61 complex subunit gamma [Candidatus Woesearchaeota archaeon]
MSFGSKVKDSMKRIKTFVIECRRVLQITKKPSRQEFSAIVKVAGLGMIAIGAIGFVIQLARTLLTQ